MPPPLVEDAFPMPFSTLYEERWFVQYPPGTAAVLALGVLVHLPWLVQPLLAAGAVVLIVATTHRQYGAGTALLVLLLLVTSPFLLLTANSFLSHVPALFFACIALYAATRYAERPSLGWAATIALGLGLAFLTREIVSILYGLTVVLTGLGYGARQRGRAIVGDIVVMGVILLAAVGLYLGYNAALTGEPFLLPRLLVDGRDRYGFGAGVGFYNEHSVASGLVNTEEQLVSLGFYLAGWPYGFSLALVLLPFLTRRASGWDAAHGLLVGAYVLAYTAYYYHGIAFGPRYYFEALPSLAILTARGFGCLTESVAGWLAALGRSDAWWRARLATTVLAAALFACNLVYFLPRQATLYADFTGLPGGGPILDENIGHDLAGRTARLDNALVVTQEWWLYTMYFAALNCPSLDCSTVFALGADEQTREVLRRMYPDRDWYDVADRNGVLRIVPGGP
jgi:4-amino-4-deoxy-L-arabinose transferase-like glycosyltransferase